MVSKVILFNRVVEMPAPKPKTPPNSKYPFNDLEIGHMFFVTEKKAAQFRVHASKQGKALGKKFKVMDMTAEEALTKLNINEAGIGVWRIE